MQDKQIYGYIYLVKNLINGKMYFGITENNFDTRYKHGDISNTHNEHLKRSIAKYGIENFEINKEFDMAYTEDDLYDLEDMYMCIYNTLDSKYGYNKRRSGSKHKGNGKLNEETKRKIGKTKKGKPLSEEHKRKMSEATKGKPHKPHSEETKRKLSEAHKGKPLSEEHKHKIGETMKGRPRSEDFKQKISETKKIKIVCLETQQVFDSIKQAQEWLGRGNIQQHLKGRSKYAGKHPITKQPLHWMYYDEYLKTQEEQQNKTQDLVTEVA